MFSPEQQRKEIDEYLQKVFRYLEYLEYPELVQEFDTREVARALYQSIVLAHYSGISHRTCALGIYGATWTYQIVPIASRLPVN